MTSGLRQFCLAAILRLCRIRTTRYGIARDGLRFIEFQDVPEHVAKRLQPLIDAATSQGFRLCLWSTATSIGLIEGYSATLLHSNGTMYAGLAWARIAFCQPPREELILNVASKLTDGRFVCTTDAKQRLDRPKGFLVENLPGQEPHTVLKRHQERLLSLSQNDLLHLDLVSLRQTLFEASQRIQTTYIDRGIWRRLSEQEIAAILNSSEPVPVESGNATRGCR